MGAVTEEIFFMSAVALRTALHKRELSCVEVTRALLERIEAVDPKINCFVTVVGEQALALAEERQRELMRTDPADLPALHGLPVTVKDLTDTAGVRTTYGSKAFADHVPASDALTWARLKAAGAILILFMRRRGVPLLSAASARKA